jgi:hypothetical protein
MSRESVDTQSPDYPERVAEAMGISGDRLRASRPAEPWRFDVPEVPPGVTAVEDGDGDLYVRRTDDPDRWSRWLAAIKGEAHTSVSTKGLLFSLPLEERPDPRAAS